MIVGGTIFGGPGDYTRTCVGALFLTVLTTVLDRSRRQRRRRGDHLRRRSSWPPSPPTAASGGCGTACDARAAVDGQHGRLAGASSQQALDQPRRREQVEDEVQRMNGGRWRAGPGAGRWRSAARDRAGDRRRRCWSRPACSSASIGPSARGGRRHHRRQAVRADGRGRPDQPERRLQVDCRRRSRTSIRAIPGALHQEPVGDHEDHGQAAVEDRLHRLRRHQPVQRARPRPA